MRESATKDGAAVEHGGQHQKTTEHLARLLANSYILYVKTQNFHWNVVDPRFSQLHKLFEKQYEELAEAIDTIAERMRALQVRAPGSLSEFLHLTELEEAKGKLSGDAMLRELAHDHEFISKELKPWIPEAQQAKDEGSADLFIGRLREHDKAAWMLRSNL